MKKYEPGKRITSLDELARSEFVFCRGKIYHHGWFMSWPIRRCKDLVDGGLLFHAVRNPKELYVPKVGKDGEFETSDRYKEILDLRARLFLADIPHTFRPLMDGWQILYTAPKNEIVCSVIEHFGSYGNEEDLLEIMGLIDPEDDTTDAVLGHLTAENVFERIKHHWESNARREADGE